MRRILLMSASVAVAGLFYVNSAAALPSLAKSIGLGVSAEEDLIQQVHFRRYHHRRHAYRHYRGYPYRFYPRAYSYAPMYVPFGFGHHIGGHHFGGHHFGGHHFGGHFGHH